MQCQTLQDHYDELRRTVIPQAESDSYGINLYSHIFLYDKIRSHPTVYGELVCIVLCVCVYCTHENGSNSA